LAVRWQASSSTHRPSDVPPTVRMSHLCGGLRRALQQASKCPKVSLSVSSPAEGPGLASYRKPFLRTARRDHRCDTIDHASEFVYHTDGGSDNFGSPSLDHNRNGDQRSPQLCNPNAVRCAFSARVRPLPRYFAPPDGTPVVYLDRTVLSGEINKP